LTVTFVTASQVSITNTEGNVGQLLVSGGHAKIKTDETKIVKIDEQIKPEGEVTVCISSVEDKRFYLLSYYSSIPIRVFRKQTKAMITYS
jgi:hypothetical protein